MATPEALAARKAKLSQRSSEAPARGGKASRGAKGSSTQDRAKALGLMTEETEADKQPDDIFAVRAKPGPPAGAGAVPASPSPPAAPPPAPAPAPSGSTEARITVTQSDAPAPPPLPHAGAPGASAETESSASARGPSATGLGDAAVVEIVRKSHDSLRDLAKKSHAQLKELMESVYETVQRDMASQRDELVAQMRAEFGGRIAALETEVTALRQQNAELRGGVTTLKKWIEDGRVVAGRSRLLQARDGSHWMVELNPLSTEVSVLGRVPEQQP